MIVAKLMDVDHGLHQGEKSLVNLDFSLTNRNQLDFNRSIMTFLLDGSDFTNL
jgi:hypothetical protein